MMNRKLIGEAENLIKLHGNNPEPNPSVIAEAMELLEQIKSKRIGIKHQTLVNELTSIISSRNRTEVSRAPSSDNTQNIPSRNIENQPISEYSEITGLDKFYKILQIYHTYQKENRSGEFTSINGVGEKIGNNPVLTQVRKSNSDFEKNVDINNLEINIGYSPPCKDGQGFFVLRKDVGLDKDGRPSNFEYWCFSINPEQKKIVINAVNTILRSFFPIGELVSAPGDTYETYSKLELGGHSNYSDFKSYYQALVEAINCSSLIPVDDWLGKRKWYWYYPSKEHSVVFHDGMSVIFEILNSGHDFRFGEWNKLRVARNNVELHKWMSEKNDSISQILDSWEIIANKNDFISSFLSCECGGNFNKIAAIWTFEYFCRNLSNSNLYQIKNSFFSGDNKLQDFLSSSLFDVLSRCKPNSIGDNLDFIGEYLDINSDEVVDLLSNLKCWNSDAINRFNHQKELNNLEFHLSELKEKLNSREKLNKNLQRRLNEKSTERDRLSEHKSKIEQKREHISSLKSKLNDHHRWFSLFHSQPNFYHHVEQNIEHLGDSVQKEIEKRIKNSKPSGLILKRKKSTIQQHKDRSSVRTIFYFKHWNWVVKNDLKGKINQTESLLKKHENELFILEHSPEYDSESLHRLTSEVENLTNEFNENNKFIEECNIEIRRLEKLSQSA